MRLSSPKKNKVKLDITSLVDVLFILIIFFSVSSTFLEQPGIELDLPQAKTAEGHTIQKIIIYVDKDKNIFLNEQIVSLNNLASEVAELAKLQKDKGITLKADEDVPHGLIIKIMDLLREKGIYKMVISTTKQGE